MKGFGRGLCALGVVGCATGDLDKSAEVDDSGAGGGSIALDEEPSRSDAPVLHAATVFQSSTKCFLEADYTDPQGPADVRRGTVSAVDPSSGTVFWTDDLFVCVDNACIGSFDDSHVQYASAPCNQLGRYQLEAHVYDRTDNVSNSLVLDIL